MTAEKFPTAPHFAVIVFKTSTIHHEGDERSRTHPGHGYPAWTESINSIDYIPFNTQKELETWVLRAETINPKPKYRLISANPITATLIATVTIKRTFLIAVLAALMAHFLVNPLTSSLRYQAKEVTQSLTFPLRFAVPAVTRPLDQKVVKKSKLG